jgi:hypothetical protein
MLRTTNATGRIRLIRDESLMYLGARAKYTIRLLNSRTVTVRFFFFSVQLGTRNFGHHFSVTSKNCDVPKLLFIVNVTFKSQILEFIFCSCQSHVNH